MVYDNVRKHFNFRKIFIRNVLEQISVHVERRIWHAYPRTRLFFIDVFGSEKVHSSANLFPPKMTFFLLRFSSFFFPFSVKQIAFISNLVMAIYFGLIFTFNIDLHSP